MQLIYACTHVAALCPIFHDFTLSCLIRASGLEWFKENQFDIVILTKYSCIKEWSARTSFVSFFLLFYSTTSGTSCSFDTKFRVSLYEYLRVHLLGLNLSFKNTLHVSLSNLMTDFTIKNDHAWPLVRNPSRNITKTFRRKLVDLYVKSFMWFDFGSMV